MNHASTCTLKSTVDYYYHACASSRSFVMDIARQHARLFVNCRTALDGRARLLSMAVVWTALLAAAPTNNALAQSPGPASAWGALAPFPGLGQCTQTAAGYLHTLALREDGILVAWGRNYEQQCEVPADLYQFVAAGYFHSVAITTNGAVNAWGWNYYGQCNVPSNLGPCTAVSAGNGHTVALRSNGSVWAWGDNAYGQCGIATRRVGGTANSTNSNDGAYWTNSIPGIKEIAAGGYHTLALTEPTGSTTVGNVFAWGNNSYSQCSGNPPATNFSTYNPDGYYQLTIQCTKIAAGGFHSVALKKGSTVNGYVIAWGSNVSGQCGVTSADINERLSNDADLPVNITGNYENAYWTKRVGSVVNRPVPPGKGLQFLIATDIAAGYSHTLAVQEEVIFVGDVSKTVVGWGDNDYGQCGDVQFCIRKKPGLAVDGGLAPIIDCTLDKDPNSNTDPLKQTPYPIADQLRCSCWDPGTGSVYYPNRDSTLGSYWKKALGSIGSSQLVVLEKKGISAGGYHSVAIKFNGSDTEKGKGLVAAWGANNYGQCDVPPSDDEEHAEALWNEVSGGYWHTLGVDKDQRIIAWGENNSRQCEAPNSVKVEFGPFVYWATPLLGTKYLQVSAGKWHSLALTASGTVEAWGAGKTNVPNPPIYLPDNFEFGQSMVPASLPATCTAIAAGAHHSLALTNAGVVVAWGAGTTNIFGTDFNEVEWGQSMVPPLLPPCKAIAAGAYHSLALTTDGAVVAWGAGIVALPDGTTGDTLNFLWWGQSDVPIELQAANSCIAIAAGYAHSVALRTDGTVVTWGAGTRYAAEGGYSHLEYGQSIAPPGTYTKIAAGHAHNLAVHSGVETFQVYLSHTDHLPPPQPPPPTPIDYQIKDKIVVAWGWNDYGQCGFADEEVCLLIEETIPKYFNYLWFKPCLGPVSKISAGSIHSVAIREPSSITSLSPAFGPIAGGTVIVILGTNLPNNEDQPTNALDYSCLVSVTVGGQAATNVSVNPIDGSVTATTPPGIAGLVDVVVSNIYRSVVGKATFTYGGVAPFVGSVAPTIGPTSGGTTLTIQGTNLENTLSVTVGGVATTILSKSSNRVMTKTQSGVIGPADVVVTTTNGSVTQSNAFAYTNGGGYVPTITSLTPNSGDANGGTLVTIQGTNFLNTLSVSFSGTECSFGINSNTEIMAITPTGNSGLGNIVVTTYQGESCTAEDAFSYTSCAGDLDGSGTVDSADVALVLLDSGDCAGCPTDLDGSGVVDSGDVAFVLLNSGSCQ